MRSGYSAFVLAFAIAACDGNGAAPFPVEDHCNPLGTNHCMTPWPSSAFEIDDASTPTGRRLAIPEGALPTSSNDTPISPAVWNWADGFSPAAPMIVSFPGGMSAEGLVSQHDLSASLGDATPTVIVDMTTGERVAHFAELDAPAETTPDRQALYLRPAQRLVGGHRYAVAITTALEAKDGGALPISEGMQALLDDAPTSHPLLQGMRARFADVLTALDATGVTREELVLAWDFTVASDDFLWRDMFAARAQALAAMQSTPPDFTVAEDIPIDDGSVFRHRISGTFQAPLFLTNEGRYVTSTVIARDGDDLPVLQGTYDVDFTAIVPECAYTAPEPVGIMIYGHGLLGEGDQVASGAVRNAVAEACVVALGTDMRGMSSSDIGSVATALTDFNHADGVFEVLVQGLVNHIALRTVAQGAMAERLFVKDGGGSLVDPSKVYYYGISQGGIFGTPVVAWDPAIRRGVLGVGAGGYANMLERSSDWPEYRTILLGAYPDSLDLTLLINLMQMRWDKTETSGIAHVVTDGTTLDSGGPKQILMQIALGDDQVPNLASWWQARSMGLPVLGPSVEEPWGMTAASGPLTDSALVIFDGRAEGDPPIPDENVPAPNTGAHYVPRNQPATWRQIKAFYETGMIVNECDGACLCPTACQ